MDNIREILLEDKCPKCKANLNFTSGFNLIDNGQGFYICNCYQCGFEGKQWHKISFDGFEGADGNEVLIKQGKG